MRLPLFVFQLGNLYSLQETRREVRLHPDFCQRCDLGKCLKEERTWRFLEKSFAEWSAVRMRNCGIRNEAFRCVKMSRSHPCTGRHGL